MKTRIAAVLVLGLALSACAFSPPQPPDAPSGPWVPVNLIKPVTP